MNQGVSPSVLIVEDDPDLRVMMLVLLDMEGFDAVSAENGRAALKVLCHSQAMPKVILLDLMMPVMDGWEFRRRQLADCRFAAIPVIVVSALSRIQSAELQPAAIVPKPCDFTHLTTLLRRLLKATGAA